MINKTRVETTILSNRFTFTIWMMDGELNYTCVDSSNNEITYEDFENEPFIDEDEVTEWCWRQLK